MAEPSTMVASGPANCGEREGSAPTGGFHFVAKTTVSSTAGPSIAVVPTHVAYKGPSEDGAYSAPFPPAGVAYRGLSEDGAYSAPLPPAGVAYRGPSEVGAYSAPRPPAAGQTAATPPSHAFADPWADHSPVAGGWADQPPVAVDPRAAHSGVGVTDDAIGVDHSPSAVDDPGATGVSTTAAISHGAAAVCFGPAASEAAEAVKVTPSHPPLP
jgi:hypothetical protein